MFQRRRSSVIVSEEQPDDHRFRPETGITSATTYNRHQSDSRSQHTDMSRQRRTANDYQTNDENGLVANHNSHLRTGVGVGMFKQEHALERIEEATVFSGGGMLDEEVVVLAVVVVLAAEVARFCQSAVSNSRLTVSLH